MLRNASVFEVSWTVISLVGVFVYSIVGYLALGDRRYLHQPRGIVERRALTTRTIISTQHLSIALLLGGMEVAFVVAGIITSILPNAPNATPGLTPTGAILLLAFFLAHGALIGVAIVLLVGRSRVLAKADADYEHLMALRARLGMEASDTSTISVRMENAGITPGRDMEP